MKRYEFLKDNKKLMNFVIYPLIAIFIVNFIFFIIGSVYDFEIMEIFAHGIKFDLLKYISIFNLESGYTELYIAFILAGFIILEYTIYYKRKNKGINEKNSPVAIIFGLVLIWILLMTLKTYRKWEFDFWVETKEGLSIQFSLTKMLTATEYRSILVCVIIYQFILLLAVLLYAKLVFFKKPDFYEKQYWKISIKVIVYFFIAYGLVGTMKIVMGRDYYSGMEKVVNDRIELYESMTGVKLELTDDLITSPEGYQPWWTFNGLIGNPDKITWTFDKLFNNNAFPSGHMAQVGVVGSCIFFIIEPRNSNTLNKWKITIIYLFFLQQLMTVLSFLINGSHWITDTTFTWMWSIYVIYLSNLSVDKYFERRIIKKEEAKSVKLK
ncbi:phosphatase PAP2 family protein [Spiroplasma culicicola]|uniref:Phosphatidic acid phosphatase type 2/haloperoxidase domain-containing protein n=1 Tax=Spiroplasma culicicola AES-1 TaxID=1276246 RepID=W6AFZ1_9MOLU|nr:phosphatase PAP2 family protein [Spiroplasma culicicola]AHI52629.1 hypothetical protein SCULI_v1c02880 [Spiroplasma culicicola AES-1]